MIMANNDQNSFFDADYNRGERRYSLREFLIEQLNRDSRGDSHGVGGSAKIQSNSS